MRSEEPGRDRETPGPRRDPEKGPFEPEKNPLDPAAADSPREHAPAGGHGRAGSCEVICGPMFSGKTEELIRRLRRAQIARQRVVILKPSVDVRYSGDHIVSHSQQRIPSITVRNAAEILEHAADAEVIGIDEAQFLDQGLVDVCERLANAGKRVIVAGLDLDYRGRPFEPIPQLLARAEYITKALAICVVCGAPAARSQRVSSREERILVGSTDLYEARCRSCFEPPDEETP